MARKVGVVGNPKGVAKTICAQPPQNRLAVDCTHIEGCAWRPETSYVKNGKKYNRVGFCTKGQAKKAK